MSKPPNVLWLLSDQQPAHMLSIAGNPNLSTPHCDQLARNGQYWSHAVSGFPLCCPFRGSMITGLYPHKAVPGHERRLDPSLRTIAHEMNDGGYHTAYFGKWHLDGFHESDGRGALHVVPPERRGGFQEWCALECNNSFFDTWLHGGEGKTAFHEKVEGYEPDILTDRFLDHLEERAEADLPFFAVLSVQPPHNPYTAPAEDLARHNPSSIEFRPNVPPVSAIREQSRKDLAGAYAMVENWDRNIGRILERLQHLDLLSDTHVLVFSDHGDMHGSHGLRKKIHPHEESIRIPFIMGGWRQFYDCGSGTVTQPINHVDIAPTTLGLCGLPIPESMQGTDYSSLRLEGQPPEDMPDSAYLQCVESPGHSMGTNKPWRGLVTRDGWKYICFEGTSWLMFNLNEDPYEFCNLAHLNKYRDIRTRLQQRLKRWVRETGDSFHIPED